MSATSHTLMISNGQRSFRWKMPLLVFVLCYVGAHLALSRISARLVQRDWEVSGFFYIPVECDTFAAHERLLMPVHIALSFVFLPAWKIDTAFGGPQPLMHIQRIGSLPSP